MLDILIASVDLVDVVDLAHTIGRQSSYPAWRYRHGYRRGHVVGLELARVVMTDHHSAVGVTKDDLCTHVDQFVDEEETRLEHLLMDQYRSACLGGYDEHHAQQVRRQSRPRGIRYRQDRTVQEGVDLIMFLRRNHDIVAIYVNTDTQPPERIGDDTQVAIGHV